MSYAKCPYYASSHLLRWGASFGGLPVLLVLLLVLLFLLLLLLLLARCAVA